MLATTGEHGEPIVALCSCLKKLPWKVNTQFSSTSFRSFITSFFWRPHLLPVNENPYLPFTCGSSMCSVKGLLMTSRAVGTGILLKRADTSKDTSFSLFPMCIDLRYSLKHLLSFTNEGMIPV